jgi:hypothetical protein
MMANIYHDLLREIERGGFQVLHQRISLTPLRKLWIAARRSGAADEHGPGAPAGRGRCRLGRPGGRRAGHRGGAQVVLFDMARQPAGGRAARPRTAWTWTTASTS